MTPPTDRSKSSPSKASPAARVTEQLAAIDTTLLDKLIDARAEHTRLSDYLSRAEERRETVTNTVWRRVVEDYRRRAAALEAESAPLKEQVRREYHKLRALIEGIQNVNNEAQLARDELEFRREVGELTEAALRDGLKQPEKVLAQCEADLVAVNAQKSRFVDALGSEADLIDETPIVQTSAALDDDPTDPIEPGGTQEAPAAKVDLARTQPPSMTRVVPAVEAPEPAVEAPDEADDDEDKDDDEDRTFLLPAAALLITFEGQDVATEYRLAALNYVGRSEDNQLQVARPGVSRKHALVAATVDGFSVQDLGSQNGTYVNGERITERSLVDGDQIVIGDTQLVFRLPWPSTGKAAAQAT